MKSALTYDFCTQLQVRLEAVDREELKLETLYLLPTPLGNLGDMTLRSLVYLAKLDVLFCEDTRNTKKLLQAYGLEVSLKAAHEHNIEEATGQIIKALEDNKYVGLCSDAGLPLISDPGAEIVSACREAGYSVSVLPGPSAAITAFVGSGIGKNNFLFFGFLPRLAKKREEVLEHLFYERSSLIFYEAPHRLLDCLKSMVKKGYATRQISLARELTKKFETWQIMQVQELLAYYEKNKAQGEIVLVVAGHQEAEAEDEEEKTHLFSKDYDLFNIFSLAYSKTKSLKQTAEDVARSLGQKKNYVYRQALLWKKEGRLD